MSDISTESVTPIREHVAEELRALLARRRMSATELARRIGATQPYLWRRMSGEISFDIDDLQKIAAVLGVGVSDLLPKTNTLRKTATPLGERVVATVGEDRKARTRPHRPGRPVRQTRPVDQMTRPATRVAAGR